MEQGVRTQDSIDNVDMEGSTLHRVLGTGQYRISEVIDNHLIQTMFDVENKAVCGCEWCVVNNDILWTLPLPLS